MSTILAPHEQPTLDVSRPHDVFGRVLPRLAVLYERGLLVPFLGAGMSIGTCPGWDALVLQLERAAGTQPPVQQGTQPGEAGGETAGDGSTPQGEVGKIGADDLVRRANRAIRTLSRGGPDRLAEVLRGLLYPGPGQSAAAPAQTRALAQLWWPLVLSTNYDDVFASAYVTARRAERGTRLGFTEPYGPSDLEVLGRCQADCQRVLGALDATTTSVLWALHGFLPRRDAQNGTPFDTSRHLAAETVVGHEEYRRIAHASTHYRRAFAEVARRRSFLFVGAGLRDVYLLDLFAEVQELYGPGPYPHFALVQRGETDIDFLRTRFNIVAIEYDTHGALPQMLDRLAEVVRRSAARRRRWSYTAAGPDAEHALEIVHERLPDRLGDDDAVAVSAGFEADRGPGAGRPFIDDGVRPTVKKLRASFLDAVDAHRLQRSGQFLHQEPGGDGRRAGPVVAVTAWADTARRDLRKIGDAATDAFDWAVRNGYGHLRMTLLAAGTSRHFAARFSLSEIVRAFGRWSRHRHGQGKPLTLTVHALPNSVCFEMASGRMDVVELLTCDDVRFWVEVAEVNGRVEREPAFYPAETTIADVAAALGLAPDAWEPIVEPTPMPSGGTPSWDMTLRDVGVLPGTTLRFARAGAPSVRGGADISDVEQRRTTLRPEA